MEYMGIELKAIILLEKVGNEYKLTAPADAKPGIYSLNIKDKNGKYNLPERKVLYGDPNARVWELMRDTKNKINQPYFIKKWTNKYSYEYHHGKISQGNSEAIDALNKNIEMIVLTTLGSTTVQTYLPSDKDGFIKKGEINNFYNENGSVNLDYKAGSYVIDNQYKNLNFVKDIAEMKVDNDPVRVVYVFYWGDMYTRIEYPFSAYKENDPNPSVILGRYPLSEKQFN